MRRTVALVGPHGDRDFGDASASSGRLDQGFGSELHPVGAEIEAGSKLTRETTHSAIDVADAGAKEEVQNAGEDRRTQMAVVPGHGAFFDLAHETVADD